MSDKAIERVWERAGRGLHTAAVGFGWLDAPALPRLIRVSCDVPRTTLGSLFDAQQKIEQALDTQPALIVQARDMVMSGLRRRFLGDIPARAADAALVEACNRLARQGRSYALVFDAFDAADEVTCTYLQRIIERPGWLELPLVLSLRELDPQSPAADVLSALRRAHGDAALVEADDEDAAALADDERELDSAEPGELVDELGDIDDDDMVLDLAELPSEVLRVLRAGAVVGSGFETALVAELLQCDSLEVLDCLQAASDAGVPIDDRGENRFFLPESLIDLLRSSLLPSLAATWHRRLGKILSGQARAPVDAPVEPMPMAAPGPPQPLADPLSDPAEAMETATGPRDIDAFVDAGAMETDAAYADIFDAAERLEAAPQPGRELLAAEPGIGDLPGAGASASLDRAESAGHSGQDYADESEIENAAQRWVRAHAPSLSEHRPDNVHPIRPREDQARAAEHLSAAGDLEAAAERYAHAAAEAAALGAYSQAMAHGQKALRVLEGLPTSKGRRRFRAQLLVALGRLQWQAASTHGERPDPAFSLASALTTAEAAQHSLSDGDPPAQLAEAATLVAGICYDLGDLRSLERALDQLTRASLLLLDSGDAIGAARLLNDQAAVYVRLGDPVRASHLLSRSQAIFEKRARNEEMSQASGAPPSPGGLGDSVTVQELAETHHLLARLPLHARIRPGREADAFTMALDHARIAEESYRDLGLPREMGRVWETMGRLELARGQLDGAVDRLASALQLQSQTGDLTGLARSTAALSEVLVRDGKLRQAIELLGDSIMLNREKGSPIGLAFNRRALKALTATLDGQAPGNEVADEIADAIVEVNSRLESAEETIGRIELPGSAELAPVAE